DADGLDQDVVVAGDVQDVDGVEGRPGHAAESAAGRHAADVHPLVPRQVAHADAIAHDRAARVRARGIDGDDPHLVPELAQAAGEHRYHRGLPAAGHAGDADDVRLAGARVDLAQRLAALGI